jgi:hypothetical protein
VVVEPRYRDDFRFVARRDPAVAEHLNRVLGSMPNRTRIGTYEIFRR